MTGTMGCYTAAWQLVDRVFVAAWMCLSLLACEHNPPVPSVEGRAEQAARVRAMLGALDTRGLSFAGERTSDPLVVEELTRALLETALHARHEAEQGAAEQHASVAAWNAIIEALREAQLAPYVRQCGSRAKGGDAAAQTCVMLLGELSALTRTRLEQQLVTISQPTTPNR